MYSVHIDDVSLSVSFFVAIVSQAPDDNPDTSIIACNFDIISFVCYSYVI